MSKSPHPQAIPRARKACAVFGKEHIDKILGLALFSNSLPFKG
jgi:hypothetical protein